MAHVGARPWGRDEDDNRVLFFIPEGRGEIINDEKDASTYPKQKETRAPFVEADWDLATMEPRSGKYPGRKQQFTLAGLSGVTWDSRRIRHN